jgi:hypothetical protein
MCGIKEVRESRASHSSNFERNYARHGPARTRMASIKCGKWVSRRPNQSAFGARIQKITPVRKCLPLDSRFQSFLGSGGEDSYLKEPARRVGSNSNGDTKSLFQDSKEEKLSLCCTSFALF